MRGPPDPEMRSPAAANGRANRNRREVIDHPKNTAKARQAQRLRRMFALMVETASAIAELAYAGLPR